MCFYLLQQQERHDEGIICSECIHLECKTLDNGPQKFDTEVITWLGLSHESLFSHMVIVQLLQKSVLRTDIACLFRRKDTLLKDIFCEEGITVGNLDQLR